MNKMDKMELGCSDKDNVDVIRLFLRFLSYLRGKGGYLIGNPFFRSSLVSFPLILSVFVVVSRLYL